MPETSLHTFNDTSEESLNKTDIDFTLHLTMALPSQIICLPGLAGNGVVIWFLCFRIKRNPITVYILNLAVVDFSLLLGLLIGLLCLLIEASGVVVSTNLYYFGFALNVFFLFGYNTSLFLLTAISMERCTSVVFPIWYKCRRPKHLSIIICALLWVLAFIEAMLEMFVCTPEQVHIMASNCTAVILSLALTSFGIVTPLMILSSLVLIFQVQRISIKRQPKRLYRAILLNVLVFLVCTFPTRLTFLLKYLQVIVLNSSDNLVSIYVHFFLTSINSCANPFIYFLVGRNKKRKSGRFITVAFRRVFGGDTEVPSGQDETPNSSVSRTRELALSES